MFKVGDKVTFIGEIVALFEGTRCQGAYVKVDQDGLQEVAVFLNKLRPYGDEPSEQDEISDAEPSEQDEILKPPLSRTEILMAMGSVCTREMAILEQLLEDLAQRKAE